MVICINKYPLWSKSHPKNTPVLIYDNWEDKVLYANHYDYQVDNLDYKILTHDPDKEYYLGFDMIFSICQVSLNKFFLLLYPHH